MPVVRALSEFQHMPYRSMQVSNIKRTPDEESTQVPIAAASAKRVEERPNLGNIAENPLEIDSTQGIENEQWEFIKKEVERMKEAREDVQREQQRLKEKQEEIK